VTRAALGLGLALAVGLVAGGCGGATAVGFSEQWPNQAGDYRDITADWTRHAELNAGYQEALVVDATFKSAEWRAASIERTVRLGGLDGTQRAALTQQAQKDLAEHYEVQLLVTTWDRRENDLHRGPKSVWKVVLIDDAGVAIEAASIERDRRPENVLRAEYPALGDFSQAYIAKFPRRVDLLRSSARAFKLRIWGARGAVEMVWRNRA
jgi:hypothetical protein